MASQSRTIRSTTRLLGIGQSQQLLAFDGCGGLLVQRTRQLCAFDRHFSRRISEFEGHLESQFVDRNALVLWMSSIAGGVSSVSFYHHKMCVQTYLGWALAGRTLRLGCRRLRAWVDDNHGTDNNRVELRLLDLRISFFLCACNRVASLIFIGPCSSGA